MFLMIIYWMAGIIEFGRYFLAMLLMSQVSLGMGLFLSALAPNVVVATALTPALAMPMQLFGGFLSNTDTMPAWIGWIQWLTPFRYLNEALCHTQFDTSDSASAAAFMETEGFTIGYWKCIAAAFAMVIFWRIVSLMVLKWKVKTV